MVVEAIKAIFGSLPSAPGSLFASASPSEEGRKEIRRKARAWKLASHEAKQALPAVPGAQVPAPAMLSDGAATWPRALRSHFVTHTSAAIAECDKSN